MPHMRFDNDDDEDLPDADADAGEPPHGPGPVRLGPLLTARVGADLKGRVGGNSVGGEVFALDVLESPSSPLLAVLPSLPFLLLYDPAALLRPAAILSAAATGSDKAGPVLTEACWVDDGGGKEIAACGKDGRVRVWDARTGQQVQELSVGHSAGPAAELWSCAIHGTGLVAAGAHDRVVFWDRRRAGGKMVGAFEECHGDAVTQVRFAPPHSRPSPSSSSSSPVLVSASADGLICVYENLASSAFDEDEAVTQIMNVGSAVARVGFGGEGGRNLWCVTTTETLSVWEWDDAEPIAEYAETRAQASALCDTQVDYLIRCVHDPSAKTLALAAGTQAGDVALFDASSSVRYVGRPASRKGILGRPAVVFTGGHDGVVRGLCWTAEGADTHRLQQAAGPVVCYSCGEDGRVVAWGAVEGEIAGGSGGMRRGVGSGVVYLRGGGEGIEEGGRLRKQRTGALAIRHDRHSPY